VSACWKLGRLHRLESVIPCDRIFVLGGGHIVKSGTHCTLIDARGAYSRMWAAAQQRTQPPSA